MAHYQRQIGAAALLNTAISAGEAVAAVHVGSVSLLTDSVHNLSDELALVSLYLVFVLPSALKRLSTRTANLMNSIGLIVVSAALVWESVERLRQPAPLAGAVPIAVGLAAAAANWGVARLLRAPAEGNAAIRLAYIHNRGDVFVSLAPVAAGLLVSAFGNPLFDPLVALGIAAWLIGSTLYELARSSEQLIWPEEIVCDHAPESAPAVSAA